jgi:hypothetical protein
MLSNDPDEIPLPGGLLRRALQLQLLRVAGRRAAAAHAALGRGTAIKKLRIVTLIYLGFGATEKGP